MNTSFPFFDLCARLSCTVGLIRKGYIHQAVKLSFAGECAPKCNLGARRKLLNIYTGLFAFLFPFLAHECALGGVITIYADGSSSCYARAVYPNLTMPTGDGVLYAASNAGGDYGYFYLTRGYVKFNLPTIVPGTYISSAILKGAVGSQGYASTATLSLYFAATDSWNSQTLTWNNQPGSAGSAIGSFARPSNTNQTIPKTWDITSTVNAKYNAGGTLSLMLRMDDESWQNQNPWTGGYVTGDFSQGSNRLSITCTISQLPSLPSVTTQSASKVAANSAILNGLVNPNGTATTATFEYGLTTAYSSSSGADLTTNNATTPQNVSATLGGLTPGTTYHYRLDATNASGTAQGADMTFTTMPTPLVFIPGIAGSKLTGNGQTGNPPSGNGNHRYLWPTVAPADIESLNLRTGAQDVKAVDVVSDYGELGADFALVTVYKPFVAHITGTGTGNLNYSAFNLSDDPTRLTSNFSQGYNASSGTLPRYFPFPYDWRKSYDTNTATLHAYIANIRQLYGGAKVNVVAHSAGGLLLRRYILDYGSGDVDRVITVGAPFLGAPKAIYRTLTGNFNGPPVDWLTRPDMKAALATLPGVHELLPSDLYLNNGGSPIFSEDHWDINGDRMSDANGAEIYTTTQYKDLVNAQVKQNEIDYATQIGVPLANSDVPSQNNDTFHNYLSGRQDNWSADGGSIQYLHICGQQTTDATTVAVTAKAETRFGWTPFPQQIFRFKEIFGVGDGVVPLFSAQRLPQFLAPGAITRVVPGANSDVEHTALMGNPTVLSMIDAFLNGNTVPTAPAVSVGGNTAKRHIEITGCGYVTLFNTANYQNTKLSDLAAQQIPGVTVHYGGSDPWVDIDVDSNVDLTVQGATANQVIEVAVTQLDSSGNPLSFWRYQLSPTGHSWQAYFPPSSGSSGTSARKRTNAVTSPDPVVSVDVNGNGTFEVNEQAAPAYSSSSRPVDTTPPSLDMTVSPSGDSLIVNLNARDDGSVAPTILYVLDDGPVQTYRAPLTFTSTNAAVLKAFAQDGAGNTSGMITTTVGPTITAQRTTTGLVLQWPQADAYVLEQTDNLGETWTRSTAQITRIGFMESATVTVSTSKQGFFRLRSQTITK